MPSVTTHSLSDKSLQEEDELIESIESFIETLIDGRLAFDMIPPVEDLQEILEDLLRNGSNA